MICFYNNLLFFLSPPLSLLLEWERDKKQKKFTHSVVFILCIILFIIVFCFVYFLSHYLRKWVDPITLWNFLLFFLLLLVEHVCGEHMLYTHTHIAYIDWTICANRRAQLAAAAAATRASSALRRIFAMKNRLLLVVLLAIPAAEQAVAAKRGRGAGLHDLIVIIDKVSTCSHSLCLSLPSHALSVSHAGLFEHPLPHLLSVFQNVPRHSLRTFLQFRFLRLTTTMTARQLCLSFSLDTL